MFYKKRMRSMYYMVPHVTTRVYNITIIIHVSDVKRNGKYYNNMII